MSAKNSTYHLLTLSAEKILMTCSVQTIDRRVVPDFHIDLRSSLGKDAVLYSKLYYSNGLLDQICRELDAVERNNGTDPAQSLVFLDFTSKKSPSLFDEYGKNKDIPTKGQIGKAELESDPWFQLFSLFDPEVGFRLTFENGITKRFVPFDRSASMSRNYRLSFVDAALKPGLDRRLCLGMDFTRIETVSSKLYAYRGLYLSTGRRVETDDERFVLNRESVVVLKDKSLLLQRFEGENLSNFYPEPDDGEWPSCKVYDGEGLVSPAYAAEIRRQLTLEKDATSFQIRLPFGKGVLHEVDYLRFLREECGADTAKPVWVEDAFGRKRDLTRAEIILTESMLKCAKWLKDWLKYSDNGDTDPMQYYFDRFLEFGHSLYVTGTSHNLHNTGSIPMNYQFLSTLDLSGANLSLLVEKQRQQIRNVIEILRSQGEQLLRSDGTSDAEELEDSDSEPDADWEASCDYLKKCQMALSLNRDFAEEYTVKGMIDTTRENLEKDIGLGRFSVSGEQRFLSNDLLGFCVDLAVLAAKHTAGMNAAQARGLYRHCLKPERFYMAERVMKIKARLPYVFLRSPHLSRNEQCLLLPFVDPGSLHVRYFSHLTGVVMLANNSNVPAALSGADFDGDLVKIVSEKAVVEAVKRSAYIKSGKHFRRALPVIQIPGKMASVQRDTGSIPFETVRNTFSNQVGYISNLAVKYAALEYGQGAEAYKGKCASCTLVTGLEIDAAKTGIHPEEEIRELAAQLPKGFENSYLDVKETLKQMQRWKLRSFDKPQLRTKPSEGGAGKWTIKLYGSKKAMVQDKPLLQGTYYPPEAAVAPPERLPGELLFYLKCKAEEPESGGNKKTGKAWFRFMEAPDWKGVLDKELKRETRYLIGAYSKALSTINDRFRARDEAGSVWEGRFYTLLQVAYDSLIQPLPGMGITVEDAARNSFCYLRNLLRNEEGAWEALQRAETPEEWYFTPKERRTERLAEILGADCEAIPKETALLLCDFQNRGYSLLLEVLRHLCKELPEDGTAEGRAPEADGSKYNPYDADFTPLVLQCEEEKRSKGMSVHLLNRLGREKLEELFESDMDLALRYSSAVSDAPYRSRFIWNLFDMEELRRNIRHETAPGGVGNAG